MYLINTSISDKEKSKMGELYSQSRSMKVVASRFGRSTSTVSKYLHEMGVKVNPPGYVEPDKRRGNRKYQINDKYFDNINSEEKAYWLGFITADGTIHDDHVRLVLSKGDKTHLYKFRRALNSNHPVVTRLHEHKKLKKSYPQVVFCPYSVRLVRGLIKHGVMPRKSKIARPYNELSEKLAIAYWRGVFDGDGSIFKTKRDNRIHVSLVGSKEMVIGFKEFMKKYSNTDADIGHVRNGTYHIRTVKIDAVLDILELLYSNSKIYLNRKRLLANKYIDELYKKRKYHRR